MRILFWTGESIIEEDAGSLTQATNRVAELLAAGKARLAQILDHSGRVLSMKAA